MIRSLKHAFNETRSKLTVFVIALPLYLIWTGLPPSLWLDVERIRVEDSREGEPILIHVDRTIHRPFTASWAVEVELLTPGGWKILHTSPGSNNYTPDMEQQLSANLTWWAGERLSLSPGTYRLVTCWRIHLDWLRDRRFCSTSNVFRVVPWWSPS